LPARLGPQRAPCTGRGILGAPILQSSVWNVTASEIELKGGVTIEVVTRSYQTVRGRSVCVAVLDELAFWRDDDSANPDSEVLNAVRASMATFGSDAMVIAGSSPYARRGVLWDAFRRWHAKDNACNLVWRAATRTMNPTVSQDFVDAEFERDPASAAAEYGAEFRSDVAEFVSMDVLDGCTADGVFELPPISGVSYIAFVDPSGGSSDSMTLAIAHREDDGVAVLDCVREVMAPFSPEIVVEDFCRTLAAYGVEKVTGDRYAGEWPAEQFAKRNITYEPSERVKSDIYRDALPLLNSGRCRLLDVKRLIGQLHGLERRTARGGRDSIDHGPGAHDDISNAVAGALVLAAGETDYATLWGKFGAVFADPPVIRTDLDPATRAALIWRARGAGWRDCVALPADIVAALGAIELEQATENVG
jgi:hypothetical protein